MPIIEKGHDLWEGTLLTRWQGYPKKRDQERQKIHRSDGNAKGKQSPSLTAFHCCGGRRQDCARGDPKGSELPMVQAGMKCFRLPWQATQAPGPALWEGAPACLGKPALAPRVHAASSVNRWREKQPAEMGGGGGGGGAVFLNPAELANVGAVCWYLERCGWRQGWQTRTPYTGVSAEVPVL